MATIPGQHIMKIEIRENDDGEEEEFPVSLLQPDGNEKDSQGKGVGNEQPSGTGTCTVTTQEENNVNTGDSSVNAT
jgi:hypothetical protein